MTNYLLKNNKVFAINTKALMLIVTLFCLSFSSYSENTSATFKSEGMTLKLEKVIGGFKTPWAITFVSKNKLLVTEREGHIYLLDIEKSTKTTLRNTPAVMVAGRDDGCRLITKL